MWYWGAIKTLPKAQQTQGLSSVTCRGHVTSSFYTQFCLKDWHFWQKGPFSDQKKCHFEWPYQNSKTTFIVQTFPKYGPYDFYLVNLSLLGAILAIFQFCGSLPFTIFYNLISFVPLSFESKGPGINSLVHVCSLPTRSKVTLVASICLFLFLLYKDTVKPFSTNAFLENTMIPYIVSILVIKSYYFSWGLFLFLLDCREIGSKIHKI